MFWPKSYQSKYGAIDNSIESYEEHTAPVPVYCLLCALLFAGGELWVFINGLFNRYEDTQIQTVSL